MAKKRKARKKANERQPGAAAANEHVLDRLYVVIEGRKGADPATSYTARLFSRGRQQIAKKLGEEAVEHVRVDARKAVLALLAVRLLLGFLALCHSRGNSAARGVGDRR